MRWLTNSLHWCHRMFWYSFAVIAILLAIAISLIRLFITDVKDYREEVERFASTVLEQDVKIDAMDAQLSGFSPQIVFTGVKLLAEDTETELIRFEQAKLTIDPVRSLFNFKIIPQTLTVDGVSIGVRRKLDGTFSVQGLNLEQLGEQLTLSGPNKKSQTNELADWFFRRSELAIQNSTVIWQDEKNDNKIIRLENVNFFLRNDEDRHQLNGAISLPEDVGESLEVAVDFDGNLLDPRQWSGQFYAHAKAVSVQNWAIKPTVLNAELHSGTADLRLWGDSEAGKIRHLSADFSLASFEALLGTEKDRLAVKQFSGLFNWQAKEHGWLMTADKLQFEGATGPWPTTILQIDYQSEADDLKRLTGYASYLRLQDVKEVLTRTQLISDDIRQFLMVLEPQGELHDLALQTTSIKERPQYHISTRMENVSISPYQKFPGLKNISAELVANEQRGHAVISDRDGQLYLPKLFREPFELAELDATVNWWHADKQWMIDASNVQFANADVSGSLSVRGLIPDTKASPYLDLQVAFADGNGRSVYKYLPVSIMDEELVDWLDNAFKSGKVPRGGFLFNGRLADFPFRNHDGTMLADFYAEDLQLHYLEAWPDIQVNDGHVMISGTGITASIADGEMYASKLHDGWVTIDDFWQPRLQINGSFNGETRDLLQYLVNSPIAADAKDFLARSKVSGELAGKLAIHVPLATRLEASYPLDYHVETTIKDSRVELWDRKLVVNAINGEISYRPGKLRSRGLKGKFLQQDIVLQLSSRNEDESSEIQLSMKGKLDAKKIHEYIPSVILEKLTGVTAWEGVLSFGKHFTDGRSTPGYLHVTSQLDGVSSTLPMPLRKSAGEKKAVKVQLRLPDKNILPLYVRYGEDFTAALALNLDSNAALLKKGNVIFLAETAQMPKKDELLIKGWLTELPLTQWSELLRHETRDVSRPLLDPAVPIRFDLDYLNLKTVDADTPTATQAADPRNVPLISGEIRKFVHNDVVIGKVDVQTSRHVDGLSFNELHVEGPHLSVSGDGNWLLRDGVPLTNLVLQATSNDLGNLLTDHGYSAVIRNGHLQSVIQANWNDAPQNFALDKLNANIGAVISDGVISEVKPGAGRLLGLLSLSELPRRLQLDFSEFRNGLAFSQIVGQVEISNGNSNIDTLRIISPVALMQIEGSTSLVDKTFDQTLRVVPNISGTAPIVSWLTLGGQVGALVFLLDQMFGDTFDEAAGTDYRITGTWQEPVITQIKTTLPKTGAGQSGE